MKKALWLTASCLLLAGATWKVWHKPHSALKAQKTTRQKPAGSGNRMPSSVNSPKQQGSSKLPGASVTVPSSLQPEFVKELDSYQSLRSKTFLTEAEEAQKRQWLQDPKMLAQVGDVLLNTQAMQAPQYEEKENAALDLLLEAFHSGDQASAEEVIWKILKDPQIEDESLPATVRETLAGIKAEVLYQTTASSRLSTAQLEKSLPGPVSQRIWSNVKEQQQDNLAESHLEVQAHQAKWSRN